ncbi:hypothetical protein OIE63_04675 [Streptomyces sp. NBC_01795]|uniref:hypothetical protein n=1 Tax=Streptomyces sp. NBC_01795 TaxID=2975943 RepID=UPI002DD8DB70|nr:hypothetical protein [Streptomyces sp. NBC_01795]WSA90911.1 hypothetical protein OIE63_04675 [Streptomyces sp. NBC_01795]
MARKDAREARELAASVESDRERLEIRMRCCSVLFRAAGARGRKREAAKLVQELETVCDALIESWGAEHPRALAALVTLAAARHEIAAQDGDLASAERLTDVLAAAAQRSAATLGARHPQAQAVREELERAVTASRLLAEERAGPERQGSGRSFTTAPRATPYGTRRAGPSARWPARVSAGRYTPSPGEGAASAGSTPGPTVRPFARCPASGSRRSCSPPSTRCGHAPAGSRRAS